MPTQLHLPAPPAGAQEINAVVAVVRERGDVAYFASGVPVFIHREDDRVGQRVAVAQLVRLGLARQEELSAALDIDRSTLYRHRRKLTAHGIVGVVDAKRGPRGPHRFTPRKLWELAARQQATRFSQDLAERWVRDNADAVGLLYVDGHVRPYHGTAHTLPEGYVTRRRLCMPATTDIWVQQTDAQPLFVVTAPANDDLRAMLRGAILPEVRRLVGERRVTLAFDREGWSPKFFREVHPQGFDVLTYRRGPYPAWPRRAFRPVTGVVDGRQVQYRLAERRVELLKGFAMREVRRLCDNGHQTAMVTTRTDLAIEVVAYRMFERWTQENFFRYMRQHFALDALVTYAVEPADPERTVPNPERKAVRKQLADAHTVLKTLEQQYGQRAHTNHEGHHPTMRGFKIANADLSRDIRAQLAQCQALRARLARLPERVAVKSLLDAAEIVKLAPEAKHLTDTIKMLAYRAETALVHLLAPHYVRTPDEGRAVLRELLLASADILPEADRLRIRIHSLANPRSNAALAHLCETLNGLQLRYPGTDLQLVYEAPDVA